MTGTPSGPPRRAARAARSAAQRVRFTVWARRLDARLRRSGGRLALDAPHGARFHALPFVEVHALGGTGGTCTLRLGRDVHLGRHLTLEIWAGADTLLEADDEVAFGTGGRVQLHGGRVTLGPATQVRDLVLLKVRGGELRAGRRVVASRAVNVHATERVTLGDDAGLGERTTVIDSDHTHDGGPEPWPDRPLRTSPVEVGANALISANCVVLRGARIGAGAVVAAGSVVAAGELPAGWLAAGQPAAPVRPLGRPER